MDPNQDPFSFIPPAEGGFTPEVGAMQPVGPPRTPEETQNRVSGWAKLLDRLQTDPVLGAGAMRFATQLMQQREPGTNFGTHFSKALETSIDYTAAKRAQAEKEAIDRMRAESLSGFEQARTGQVTQETQQSAEKHPEEMKKLTEAVIQSRQTTQKTAKELELISAEEQAGLRTPERLKQKAELADRYTKSQAAQNEAHARYWDLMGNAAKQKLAQQGPGARQVLHSTKIDNEDGSQSIVNTHAILDKNGNPTIYLDSYTPPRFTDINKAREQATKDVDKVTPFWGKAPYEGTKADEIERRVRAYTTPKREIVGPGGKTLTPDQFENLDRQQPGTAPKNLSAGERGMQKEVLAPLAPSGPIHVIRGPDGKVQRVGVSAETPGAAPEAVPSEAPLELAMKEFADAQDTLRSYGTIKRKSDPKGYEAAKQAVSEAKKRVDALRKEQVPNPESEIAGRKTPLRVK